MPLEKYFGKEEKIDVKKLALEELEKAVEHPEFRKLIGRETKMIKEFFGYRIETPTLPQEITPERYHEWKEKGFELHYLPPVEMTEDKEYPGWKKKPGKKYAGVGMDFWGAIKKGYLSADTAKLPSSWILIDGRNKPDRYKAGEWEYKNDILATVLKQLREDKLTEDYKDKDSRFNISWDELHRPEVKEAIAQALGVESKNLRLPRAIEWNYLGNAFYHQWDRGDSWEWFEDVNKGLPSGRLLGGSPRSGGLSWVASKPSNQRGDQLGFRPLVVFHEEKRELATPSLPEKRKF